MIQTQVYQELTLVGKVGFGIDGDDDGDDLDAGFAPPAGIQEGVPDARFEVSDSAWFVGQAWNW